jgi:transcription elongation factor S-II
LIEGSEDAAGVVLKETSELASKMKKEALQKTMEEAAQAARTDLDFELKVKNVQSGLFTCGRCKKDKCSVHQMQTRGADEPMTNFVTCLTCGHNWKQE